MNNVIDFINTQSRSLRRRAEGTTSPSPASARCREHAGDVKRCAEWTADDMRRIGLQNVKLIDTPGNPVVYGDWLGAPGAPTILFYGHYDVQPVDPLDLWNSPPFEATVRDGEIYARGSRRRQGPGVHALQGHRGPAEADRPPAGEHQDLHRRRRRSRLDASRRLRRNAQETILTADVVVISDSPMFDRGIPSICYGLRGLVYFQIDVRGHEVAICTPGSFGGAVANPAFVLAQILAQMKDQRRPHQDPGLLRRRARAERGGARRSGSGCRSTRRSTARSWARRSCSARAATRRSSASGRGRPSRSTACSAASPAKARRP